MTYTNDGKAFAKEGEKKIKEKVNNLKRDNVVPKFTSITVGDGGQNKKYLELKAKSAKKLGIKMEIVEFDKDSTTNEVVLVISKFNNDKSNHGVMVQLPFPESFTKSDKETIIDAISPSKDVDGMLGDSEFIAPVVLAVEALVSESNDYIGHNKYPYKLVVVGSKGFVGKKILKYYLVDNKQPAYLPIGVDIDSTNLAQRIKEADILISTTGKPNLIKPSMVKDGVVLIDVGAPKGDISKDAYKKASYVSPVPGGVGPLTIHFLLKNVVRAASEIVEKYKQD